MNDEQVYDLFAGIRQINERFGRTANALEAIDDKICETNDKVEETNRKLESISFELYRISEALEKIATTYLDAEKKWGNITSLTIKTDPSDGPFCSQEPEEPEGFADMA